MTEFGRTWLVQRLEPPVGSLLGGKLKDNPFIFGGGLRNGGLSDDAMDLLRDVFSFEYMGAAEYEFGAVPEALSAMAASAEAGALRASSFAIPLKAVAAPWRGDAGDIANKLCEIYVLCPTGWIKEAHKRIADLAAGKVSTKMGTSFANVLRPDASDYQPTTRGWLELDNGFMFFAGREMWEQTCALFGVEIKDYVDE